MTEAARWQPKQKYRGRAVEWNISKLNNDKQTMVAEVFLECTVGPMLGRRMKWRGWLNSPSNREQTRKELEEMGLRKDARWGDWTGMGGVEIEWTAMSEAGTDADGNPTMFFRAAFVRRVPTLSTKHSASRGDLDALNALDGLQTPSSRANGSPPPPPPPPDAGAEQQTDGDIPF